MCTSLPLPHRPTPAPVTDAASTGRTRRLRRVLRCGLLVALSLPTAMTPASTRADHVTFAAPVSGAKVSEYEVELPDAANHERRFQIPAECPEALGLYQAGVGRWGNPIEQRLWLKVANDCHFHGLLHRHPAATEDFIGDVDFYNIDLRLLPWPLPCPGGDCPGLPPGLVDLAGMMPMMPIPLRPGRVPAVSDPHACRFVDGLFRGQFEPQGDTPGTDMPCRGDTAGPGFRVMSVDYGDINGDGYRDAVLRLLPLGLGIGRAPQILPVTRFSVNGAFVLPP